ncbi:hypothetical protein CI701_07575 [Shigella sonnei]|nr:hypothetical protein [Escherichia coli]OYI03226.1 hypothetical protein CI701_07575 [Shigella sonnei]PAQ94793.1 hypothetical protein BIU73_12335 [Escherichia coli]
MSVGPENSVITERLLAATAMKTSRYSQNFYCYQPPGGQSEVVLPNKERLSLFENQTKNEQYPIFGQKIG